MREINYLCRKIKETPRGMKLIVLTDPGFFIEEDKILTSLFEEGLDILHLRKPSSEPVYCERLLSLIPESFHNRIVVHDHFYLVDEFHLMGYHLSRRNSEVPMGQTGSCTRTCYSIPEAAVEKEKCSYVLLRNIYDSISEPGNKASFSHEDLLDARQKGILDRKVIAEGGVSWERIPELMDFGFGGVAVRGDLWRHFDIHQGNDFRSLISYFRKLRKATQ